MTGMLPVDRICAACRRRSPSTPGRSVQGWRRRSGAPGHCVSRCPSGGT